MSASKNRKILIITYYWPPAGGPGVQRWLKLSKYLSRAGADITVLTVDPDHATYPLKDPSLVKDVESGIKVVRTRSGEKFDLYKKLTRKKDVPFSGFAGEKKDPGFMQKVARFVRGNFFVPDARVGWNKHAIRVASQLIEEEGIDTVITTSPPQSTQLIGLHLKRRHKVQWVSDFRDPWTDIYYSDLFYPLGITRKRERKMELDVLLESDHILTASAGFKDLFMAKSKKLSPDKFTVLTNGFDPEDFSGVQKVESDRFTLTYAGTITKQYPVEGLLQALNALDFPVRLRMIGKWDESTFEVLNNSDSHVDVEWVDYVPKAELNTRLVQSDVLLLIIPDIEKSQGIIPGKLFDYMATGNPVLAIGRNDSDVAKILHDCEAGRSFEGSDVNGIIEFLTARSKGDSSSHNADIEPYNRQLQVQTILHRL